MTSVIDPTKPTSGKAYTADVRANFAIAALEISGLQSTIVTLQSQIAALQADITTLKARQMATASLVTLNPPNTNSSKYVLAVDGVAFTLDSSNRGIVVVDGQLGNTNNASESEIQLYFGTGSPPTAGTLISNTNGEIVGVGTGMLAARSGDYDPFAISGLIYGLSARTPYWIGVGLRAISGTATLSRLSVVAFEVLDPIP